MPSSTMLRRRVAATPEPSARGAARRGAEPRAARSTSHAVSIAVGTIVDALAFAPARRCAAAASSHVSVAARALASEHGARVPSAPRRDDVNWSRSKRIVIVGGAALEAEAEAENADSSSSFFPLCPRAPPSAPRGTMASACAPLAISPRKLVNGSETDASVRPSSSPPPLLPLASPWLPRRPPRFLEVCSLPFSTMHMCVSGGISKRLKRRKSSHVRGKQSDEPTGRSEGAQPHPRACRSLPLQRHGKRVSIAATAPVFAHTRARPLNRSSTSSQIPVHRARAPRSESASSVSGATLRSRKRKGHDDGTALSGPFFVARLAPSCCAAKRPTSVPAVADAGGGLSEGDIDRRIGGVAERSRPATRGERGDTLLPLEMFERRRNFETLAAKEDEAKKKRSEQENE